MFTVLLVKIFYLVIFLCKFCHAEFLGGETHILKAKMKDSSGGYLSTGLSPWNHQNRSKNSSFRQFFLSFACFFLLLILLFGSIQFIPFRGQNNGLSATVIDRFSIDHIQEFTVPINATATKTQRNCTYYTCFDVYKCSHTHTGKIGVYLYPLLEYVDHEGTPITRKITQEFYELIEAILSSKYYTPDPSQACLFIPLFDLLNQNRIRPQDVGRALSTLPL